MFGIGENDLKERVKILGRNIDQSTARTCRHVKKKIIMCIAVTYRLYSGYTQDSLYVVARMGGFQTSKYNVLLSLMRLSAVGDYPRLGRHDGAALVLLSVHVVDDNLLHLLHVYGLIECFIFLRLSPEIRLH